MQKFGLFDLIEKLLPLEKTLKNLNPSCEKESEKPTENVKKFQENPSKIKGYAPYYLLIKKHEEISKRIDKNANLKTPKS